MIYIPGWLSKFQGIGDHQVTFAARHQSIPPSLIASSHDSLHAPEAGPTRDVRSDHRFRKICRSVHVVPSHFIHFLVVKVRESKGQEVSAEPFWSCGMVAEWWPERTSVLRDTRAGCLTPLLSLREQALRKKRVATACGPQLINRWVLHLAVSYPMLPCFDDFDDRNDRASSYDKDWQCKTSTMKLFIPPSFWVASCNVSLPQRVKEHPIVYVFYRFRFWFLGLILFYPNIPQLCLDNIIRYNNVCRCLPLSGPGKIQSPFCGHSTKNTTAIFCAANLAPSKTAMDEIMTHLSTSKRNQEGAPEKRCLPWSSVRTGHGIWSRFANHSDHSD